MLGRRGQRLPEAKREIADPAGNRTPVIQHVTSDAFVTVAICICLLKAGPEGSTLLAVKQENSGATSGLQATVTPYRDRSSRRLNLWAEGPLPLCPRLRKLYVPSHAAGNRSADIKTCFVQRRSHVRSLDLRSNILTAFSHKVTVPPGKFYTLTHSSSRKILHSYLKLECKFFLSPFSSSHSTIKIYVIRRIKKAPKNNTTL